MPEIVYNVKFRIKQEQIGKQGVADITRYEQTIERLKNTINAQAAAAGTASKATKQYTMSMKGVSQVQGNANKQVAIGNQLFFSLSDGIQDSAQFSQGFAQGMRAVGNNIGFTAELMGSFIQRTKEMNNGVLSGSAVMAGLRQSFLGVGGIIFALNTAVTLMTVFGDRIFATNKEAEKLADTIRSLAQSEYKNFTDRNMSLSDELMVLEKVLSGVRTENEELLDQLLSNTTQVELSRKEVRGFGADQLNAVIATKDLTAAVNDQSKAYGNQIDQIESINVIQGAITASENIRQKEVRDAVQRILVDRRAEIEVIQLVRKAYEDLGLTQTKEQVKLSAEFEFDIDKAMSSIQSDIDRMTKDLVEQDAKLFQDILTKLLEDSTRLRFNALDVEFLLRQQRIREYNQLEIYAEKEKADAIVSINRNMYSAISSASNILAEKNKGLAIALLTVEKGLRIAEVVVSATRQIAEVKMKALAAVPNFGLAATIASVIPFIKASAATAVASIAATGIGQGARILGGGGAGGGGARGGGGASQSRFGFQMNRIEGEQTFRTPAYTPQASSMKAPETKVEIMADRKQLYYIVKQGEEEYRQIKA